MITDPQGTVIALFLAFCRIGGCIMIMPGFSSARLPMEVRLFLSVALSMAVLPMVWDTIYPRVSGDAAGLGLLIASETLVGAVFGLIARLYASGLQFAGAAIAMSISFSGAWSAAVAAGLCAPAIRWRAHPRNGRHIQNGTFSPGARPSAGQALRTRSRTGDCRRSRLSSDG